jgi:hypothetical protein
MDSHMNARLTPKGREAMVRCVIDAQLSKTAAARRFNTTPAEQIAKAIYYALLSVLFAAAGSNLVRSVRA